MQFVVGADRTEADKALADTPEFLGPMWARVSNGALIGTPEEVVEQVAAYRDAGADGPNIALRAP